jgi:hypothetical protein
LLYCIISIFKFINNEKGEIDFIIERLRRESNAETIIFEKAEHQPIDGCGYRPKNVGIGTRPILAELHELA